MEGKTQIMAAPVQIVPVKPGVKTTEFHASAAVIAGNVLGALSGFLPPWIAAVVNGAVAIAYTVARTVEKVKATRR